MRNNSINQRRRRSTRKVDPLPCAVPGLSTLASGRAALHAAEASSRNRRRSATANPDAKGKEQP